jgi:hypothetical protein
MIETERGFFRACPFYIQDEGTARHYLSYISYYRFCEYAIEFEDERIHSSLGYVSPEIFEKYWHQKQSFFIHDVH